MRMHSYGKCSPNLAVGAVTVFALIVLYSYWNLSTHNRDLLGRLHTSEQQAIQLAKNNEALQSALDKSTGEKSKLEFAVMEEQVAEKDIRKRLSEKEYLLENTREELDTEKKESEVLRGDLRKLRNELEAKETELTDLKSKVVSLEAQLLERKTENEKLQKMLQQAESQKVLPSSSSIKEVTKVEDSLSPAFLNNDPAEQQMNPDAAAGPALPAPSKDKELEKENGGGEVNNEGVGVLPIPGGNSDNGGGNLDAAEDDRDHPIKEEGAQQDDQSPDGALSPKEIKESHIPGVGPAPPHAKDVLPQSGQDNREAAHLQDLNALK